MITPIMLPKIGLKVINKAALKFIERYKVLGTKVKMALAKEQIEHLIDIEFFYKLKISKIRI